jgi:hypothetical protein
MFPPPNSVRISNRSLTVAALIRAARTVPIGAARVSKRLLAAPTNSRGQGVLSLTSLIVLVRSYF